MKVDIIDYLGRYKNGILVLLSLGYENEFHEATFYYDANYLFITIDADLEKKIGTPIEKWIGYQKLVDDILSKIVPFEEIVNKLNYFNPEDFGLYYDDGTNSQNDENENNIQ